MDLMFQKKFGRTKISDHPLKKNPRYGRKKTSKKGWLREKIKKIGSAIASGDPIRVQKNIRVQR